MEVPKFKTFICSFLKYIKLYDIIFYILIGFFTDCALIAKLGLDGNWNWALQVVQVIFQIPEFPIHTEGTFYFGLKWQIVDRKSTFLLV